jgi:anti-sigma factor RsiW
MDCNEARALLDADIDRELSAADAQHIQAHLAACATCRETSEAIASLSRATREASYHRASPALRARIVAALPGTDAQHDTAWAAPPEQSAPGAARDDNEGRRVSRTPRRETLKDWLRALGFGSAAGLATAPRGPVATLGLRNAIAFLAACAVTAGVVLTLYRPTPSSAFVDELVASHVRAQLSGHDIDVVSSDQHTVKPWFNGRLDYAPPVEDLAANGFALTGGRLDYVDRRRVAVLVYRYRKHIIDVYVLPDVERVAVQSAPPLARDGYAIAQWHDAGMTWWAVSDAEAGVLGQLRTALSERLHGAATASEPQS